MGFHPHELRESRAARRRARCQDLLALGSDARFNTPGVPAGNWRWRCTPRSWKNFSAARRNICANSLATLTDRC